MTVEKTFAFIIKVAPLLSNASARCFDYAQHDRKLCGFVLLIDLCARLCRVNRTTCVIPSEAEESRGNEFFLIPRGGVLLLF